MNYDESVFKETQSGGPEKSGLSLPFCYLPITAVMLPTESMLFLTTLPFWFFAGSRFSLVKSHFG